MNYKKTNTIEQLERYISFTPREKREIQKIISSHPMSVNNDYLKLIDWSNPKDPIFRMAIPSTEEKSTDGSFDTSGEQLNTKLKGLQHKYAQTVLLLTTNKCATFCRHCFRKRFVGIDEEEIVTDWDLVVEYISSHREVTNVLISGGDPLTLPTGTISSILERLAGIEHIRYVRIGSRMPVVYPGRILNDRDLVHVLGDYSRRKKKLYMTTQFNHPKEITPAQRDVIRLLNDSHITVNNQTVLLKGVNDNADVMAELQSELTTVGVVPSYVFQCRPVKNIKNIFQVPLHRASSIIEETRSKLDGLSKRFRFIMSHETGKIEILGKSGDRFYFKYHHARDNNLTGRIFDLKLNATDCWLHI